MTPMGVTASAVAEAFRLGYGAGRRDGVAASHEADTQAAPGDGRAVRPLPPLVRLAG